MKSRTLSTTAMILLTPLVVLAFQAQGDHVRKADLRGRSFIAGPLKITITKFGRAVFGSRPQSSSNYVYPIQVQVENTSDEFTTFEPRRLSFVDKANRQSDVHGLIPYEDEGPMRGGNLLSAAENRRIAPKTSIKDWYDLTRQFHLPARLYYAENLLATIIE